MPSRNPKKFYSPSTKRKSKGTRKVSIGSRVPTLVGRKSKRSSSKTLRTKKVLKPLSRKSFKKNKKYRSNHKSSLGRKSRFLKHNISKSPKQFIDFSRFLDEDMPYKSNSVYVLDYEKVLNAYKGTMSGIREPETVFHEIQGIYSREEYVDKEIEHLMKDKTPDEKLIFKVYKVPLNKMDDIKMNKHFVKEIINDFEFKPQRPPRSPQLYFGYKPPLPPRRRAMSPPRPPKTFKYLSEEPEPGSESDIISLVKERGSLFENKPLRVPPRRRAMSPPRPPKTFKFFPSRNEEGINSRSADEFSFAYF
jgi:hypothetical protein